MSGLNLSLGSEMSLPLIRQSEKAECGLACLAMIASYYGYKIDIATLRNQFNTSARGLTLKQMVDIASGLNLASRPLSVPLEQLNKIQLPAILHWNLNHFVVLRASKKSNFYVHDPASGEQRFTMAEISRHFTGIALELMPSADFQQAEQIRVLKLPGLWKKIFGLNRNLLQLLGLSFLLQIIVLLSPFYLQVVIDEVISKYDYELLMTLALGFSGLALIRFFTQLLRSYVLLYFTSMLSFQMTVNLFRHLIRLPIDFFDKRHIGDILSRFTSMEPIRAMISEGFIAGIIDGLMAVTTLLMMLLYSPGLALVSVIFLFCYLLLRLFFYSPYLKTQERAIQSQARENSTFIEILKGMTHLKLSARENEREGIWKNNYSEVINNNARLKKLEIWFENSNQAIFGFEYILLIYLASLKTMGGEFTVGMIFAFLAFKQNFTEKASNLVERYIEYRLLGLHLARISDIALSEQESLGRAANVQNKQRGKATEIVLNNVHYQYGSDCQSVINNLSLVVGTGESIAIVGPSGSGKTTLLKLMSSLISPTKGEILVDGVEIHQYGLADFRRSIGVVLQEDGLFSGTIAENIAYFDSNMDMKDVRRAARLAAVDDEIQQLPMGYETSLGDMGSIISSGQKQRILLARALFRKPGMLFLDEGTANLDYEKEREVNESIASLAVTRIVVAHRPETIRYSDRVLLMANGMLEELDSNFAEVVGSQS